MLLRKARAWASELAVYQWKLLELNININFDLVSVQRTSRYVYHMSMFIASYGLVVVTNYLVVFVLLVIIYYKILKRIKRMRIIHGKWKEKEKEKEKERD